MSADHPEARSAAQSHTDSTDLHTCGDSDPKGHSKDVERSSVANTEQLELVPVPRCDYCGPLQHTIDRWGRETHKCKCPHRTDSFCEAHPTGDCEPPKPRWNPKWPLESLYGTTWEDAFPCPSDDVDESADLKETA